MQDMEKMEVDSEAKDRKPAEKEQDKLNADEEVDEKKSKDLEFIKKLRKLVEEMRQRLDDIEEEEPKGSPTERSTRAQAVIKAQ